MRKVSACWEPGQLTETHLDQHHTATLTFLRAAIHFSYFVFCECFCETHHKIRNTHYTLFVCHANFMFYYCRKNINHEILWLFVRIPTLGRNTAKCEKQKKEGETQNKRREMPRYAFFAFCNCFRVFCDKCTASLTEFNKGGNAFLDHIETGDETLKSGFAIGHQNQSDDKLEVRR